MKNHLGRYLKHNYEDALRLHLPRRSYVIIRIDGRAFHTFTQALERPYSHPLAHALDEAALHLCRSMPGCRFAYGQSDEYSFVLTDCEEHDPPLWFNGNVQKIVSVSASVFTGAFNGAFASAQPASFDSRVLLIPPRQLVIEYFHWRQLDASANSLNMLASAHYSHEELVGKSTAEKHDMLHAKGLNWAKESTEFKRGRVARRSEQASTEWSIDREIPVFTRKPAYLEALIPHCI